MSFDSRLAVDDTASTVLLGAVTGPRTAIFLPQLKRVTVVSLIDETTGPEGLDQRRQLVAKLAVGDLAFCHRDPAVKPGLRRKASRTSSVSFAPLLRTFRLRQYLGQRPDRVPPSGGEAGDFWRHSAPD